MEQKQLHPSVQEFKEFVQQHPNLVKEVRNGQSTWQELFEDWYLLGDDDPKWNSYKKEDTEKEDKKEEKDSKGLFEQITGILQKMEPDQVQQHITNLSQALGAIQGVLTQFSSGGGATGGTTPQVKSEPQERPNPFSFRKD
ncbi:spore coat protein YlbD [Bacillus spongiae]|uniref:Spore coat protein YlbD n=1 Tax=Bacillus spongiae TaxID=2683610 RepID=A0ABU8H9R6_9BACI